MGNMPKRNIFQELLTVKGTTKASGANLQSILTPFSENRFGCPFFDRVPSGKITAERWFFCIYCPRLLIAGSACFGSFLSIKTEPPCFKLNETLGMPLPNSFLLTNFGCVSRKNQIILTISNIRSEEH